MTGLAKVYGSHVPDAWEDEDWSVDSKVTLVAAGGRCSRVAPLTPRNGNCIVQMSDAHKMLEWIPGHVLLCFSYREPTLKLRVVQLLDHILIPRSVSPGARARGLLAIYNTLAASGSPRQVRALRVVLAFRRRCQDTVQSWLEARSVAHTTPSDASERRLAAVSKRLAAFHHDAAGAQKQLANLAKVRDQRVFKCLATLVNSSKTAAQLAAAKVLPCRFAYTPNVLNNSYTRVLPPATD